MITTPQDYQELLYRIQDVNRQQIAILLPKEETIFEVDLNTRTIQAPEFLSVETDHASETIYFKVDRFFDSVDLAKHATCVFCFKNADPDKNKRGYVYAPPFIDVTTFADENKILIPWVIEGPATAFAGTVSFSIQFYQVEKRYEGGRNLEEFKIFKGRLPTALEEAEADIVYIYNLNTIPSSSKVLHGIGDILNENNENYNYDTDTVLEIYRRIDNIEKLYDAGLYWLEMV